MDYKKHRSFLISSSHYHNLSLCTGREHGKSPDHKMSSKINSWFLYLSTSYHIPFQWCVYQTKRGQIKKGHCWGLQTLKILFIQRLVYLSWTTGSIGMNYECHVSYTSAMQQGLAKRTPNMTW